MDSETKTQETANAVISITTGILLQMHTITHDILKVSQVLLVLHMIPVPGIKENKQAQKLHCLFAQCGWRQGWTVFICASTCECRHIL